MKNRIPSMLIRPLFIYGLVTFLPLILWAAPARTKTNVNVMTLSAQKLEVYQSFTGYLKPYDRVIIRTEIDGAVEKINFEEGQSVQKGQILVHVSTNQAKLREQIACSNYNQALAVFNTQKNLFIDNPPEASNYLLRETALQTPISVLNAQLTALQKRYQNLLKTHPQAPCGVFDTRDKKQAPTIEMEPPMKNKIYITTKQLEIKAGIAKSNYRQALSEYQKQRELFEKNMLNVTTMEKFTNLLEVSLFTFQLSKLDLEQAKIGDISRLENFRNQKDTALFQYDLAKINSDKSRIRAPFAGVVKSKMVQVGSFVQKGHKLLEIMDIAKVLARVSIPEKQIHSIKLDKKVTVRFDAIPGKTFSGSIKTLELEADLKNRSYPAEIVIQNDHQKLLPGMMARVRMLTESKTGQIIIPRHTVLDRELGTIVFVEKSGVVTERRVKTGTMVKDTVQILSGLRVGENLVIVGQNELTDKEAVNVAARQKQSTK